MMVHYGQYSDIEVNPSGVSIELKEWKPQEVEATEKSISELEEGDRNIKLKAVVTDFEIPRFYMGCPECFKKVMQDDGSYKCGEHEEVKAQRIPIVNLVVDDGDKSISVVGFRDRAENITGLKSDEIIKLAEDIDKYRAYCKKVIGSKVELVGNVGANTMTGDKQVMANQILKIDFKDIEEIAKDLINDDSSSKKEAKLEIDDDLADIEEIEIDDELL